MTIKNTNFILATLCSMFFSGPATADQTTYDTHKRHRSPHTSTTSIMFTATVVASINMDVEEITLASGQTEVTITTWMSGPPGSFRSSFTKVIDPTFYVATLTGFELIEELKETEKNVALAKNIQE